MHEEARARVVAEARRWVGTPYHHRAAVLGAGVDCAQLLIEVYGDAGVIEKFDTGPYPCDWHLHQSEERYVELILQFADEIDPRLVESADVVAWKYGRTFSHGAIVTDWPRVVHAFAPYLCVDETDITGTALERLGAGLRPVRAFRPKAFRSA